MISSRRNITLSERLVTIVSGVIGLLTIVLAALLARRNPYSAHGDRRGHFGRQASYSSASRWKTCCAHAITATLASSGCASRE